jgi:hypothetical protein
MLPVIILLAVVGVLVFFLFSIMKVAFKPQQQQQARPLIPVGESMYDVPYTENLEKPAAAPASLPREIPAREPEPLAPIRQQEVPLPSPEVPGQTEEELHAPEPLQEQASQRVDTPSPKDPYERQDNTAMFGSNLRHPETMISKGGANFASLESEVAAGVAGRPAVEKLPFSAEMAQNGGEFMNGIFAFDSSDSSTSFSSY